MRSRKQSETSKQIRDLNAWFLMRFHLGALANGEIGISEEIPQKRRFDKRPSPPYGREAFANCNPVNIDLLIWIQLPLRLTRPPLH